MKKYPDAVPTISKQPGFYKYAATILIVAVLGNFFYANVGTDLKNLHYSYISDVWGWARTMVSWPTTIGTLVGLPAGLWLGRWTAKYGGRRIGSPAFMLLGLTLIATGIAAKTGNYPLYFVSNVVGTVAQSAMYLAIYTMTNNWFISTRGRVLGWITVANAASAVAINLMTRITEATGKFNVVVSVYGVVIIAVGVICALFTHDKPEEVRLLPDGLLRSEEEIAVLTDKSQEENQWPVKRLVRTPEAWALGIAVGCCELNMGGFLGIFVPRMLELNINIITAVNLMTFVSLSGIILSIIWGYIDDKIGTPRTATILGCLFVCANVFMLLAGFTGSRIFVYLAVFCSGSMVGGLPNLHPSLYAFVFGRKQFTYVETNLRFARCLFTIPLSLLPNYIYQWTGSYQVVYIYCGVLALIATICYASVRKTYDPERLNLKGVVNFK